MLFNPSCKRSLGWKTEHKKSESPYSIQSFLVWYRGFVFKGYNLSSKRIGTSNLQLLAQQSIPTPLREICAWLKLKPKCIALCHRWLGRTGVCSSGKHSALASPLCHLPEKKYVYITFNAKLQTSSKTREPECSIVDRFLSYDSKDAFPRTDWRHCSVPSLLS